MKKHDVQDTSEERTLKRVRALVEAGRPIPRLVERYPALHRICSTYWALQDTLAASDRPSLLSALTDALRENGSLEIDVELKRAERSARRTLFDCCADAILGRKARLGNRNFQSASIHSLLLSDPHTVVSEPGIGQYIADRLRGDGSNFLNDLKQEFYNAERRADRIPVDMQSVTLARHWTNQDVPMCLMGRDALLSLCSTLSPNPNEPWTNNTIKNRLGANKLLGPRKRPITAAKKCVGSNDYFEIQISRKLYDRLPTCDFETRFLNADGRSLNDTKHEIERQKQRLKNFSARELHLHLIYLEQKSTYPEVSGIPLRVVPDC